MVYFTGDIHGAVEGINAFIKKVHPSRDDIIVLLGDVGANFYGNRKDVMLKTWLNEAGPTFLCIHGNHEMRPTKVPGYQMKSWNGGIVWVQPEYPNLLFARDGEIFVLNGLRYLVIGGAYSVDKYYRLSKGWSWWPDEQPSTWIKTYVEKQIREKDFDIVLSHTCPYKYEPSGDVGMENSISKKRPELVSEWSPRNHPLTPDDVSYGSNKLYWWIGPCGHEWQSSAKARSAGEKCPICANARIIPGINDLKTLYPALAMEWSEKNAPLEPTQVGPGTHKKVLWHGKCGHEWAAGVRNRVAGAGCPYCSHNILLPGFNDLQTIRPELAKEWSDKNLPLLPSQVTAFANRKVWWRCAKGHEWNTLISTRSYGSKCPYCSGILTLKGFNDFETMFPALAKEWSDRNGELRPTMVNCKSRQNVWWKCGTCGCEWKSLVKTRVKGSRCPVCAERTVLSGYNDLATTDPALLSEWDYKNNREVLPERISRHSMKSVWWKCEFGHSWKDKISRRAIEDTGCPYCQNEFKSVLPQLLIMLYCSRRGLKVELSNESLLGVLIDAYIPELKLAIITVEARTKRGDNTWSVTKHLCEKRGIVLHRISVNNTADVIFVDVKRAFQSGNVFIVSDSTKDIETAWEKFILLKRKRGDGK